MKYIVLLLLMISFVSAVDVDFDCPDEIFVDEEFECSLEVFDGDGVYDVKVDLDGERNSALEIWNEDDEEWLSGYYYLKEYIWDGEEVNVKLKISEDENYDGVLKLRQDGKVKSFDIEIDVDEKEQEVEAEIKDSEKIVSDDVVVLGEVVEEVILNDKVVYESRNSKVVDNLVYGFAVFLIFIIGILVWERF